MGGPVSHGSELIGSEFGRYRRGADGVRVRITGHRIDSAMHTPRSSAAEPEKGSRDRSAASDGEADYSFRYQRQGAAGGKTVAEVLRSDARGISAS